eukprot:GHVL01024416.1.p1 GENE.GHVL01024416.1~~GHVL01024416.1.p1  ORF type:complete len:799 (-),score=150.38 GHVL01024416.1:679-3075(-)
MITEQKKYKSGGFQRMNLGSPIFKGIMKMGYKVPTPIQRKCLPIALQNKDLAAMARTGSGKTAAFLIPIAQKLLAHSTTVGVRAVILSPTRELALQTCTFCRQLTKYTDLRLCIVLGGDPIERQFDYLANNPDIIVATPGRLLHHIKLTELTLSAVEILVFDEADRLFELGFDDQLREILQSAPPSRQCLLFSATLPSKLVAFSKAGLRNPEFVRLDVDTQISKDLSMDFIYCRSGDKLAAAVTLLKDASERDEKCLLFVATRHHVEFLGALLTTCHIHASLVYGSMDHSCRMHQLARFRSGKTHILVVTDVAARGLDIPFLDLVVNLDFPSSPKLFVHRSGRTARAGRTGRVVSLITVADLPYAFETLLFCGKKLKGVDDSEDNEDCIEMGSIPYLEFETDFISSRIREDVDLARLESSMNSAFKLYLRTRSSASRSSVTRAKKYIQSMGGESVLASIYHHRYKDKINDNEIVKEDFVRNLREFRPKVNEENRAISKYSVANMSLGVKIANTDFHPNLTIVDSSQEEPRGVVHRSNMTREKRFVDPKYYLSTDVRSEELNKMLEIETHRLDLCPDEESSMKKQNHVMKWDEKKKKYILTAVDGMGKRILKPEKKIKKNNDKTDFYEKWCKKTHKRVQRVGEVEDSKLLVKRPKIDMVVDDTAPDETAIREHKETVKGVREEMMRISGGRLTHKQQRKLKKIQNLGTVTKFTEHSKHSQQLKNPDEVLKLQKKRMERLAKNNPKLRNKLAKKSQENFQRKNREKIEQRGTKMIKDIVVAIKEIKNIKINSKRDNKMDF